MILCTFWKISRHCSTMVIFFRNGGICLTKCRVPSCYKFLFLSQCWSAMKSNLQNLGKIATIMDIELQYSNTYALKYQKLCFFFMFVLLSSNNFEILEHCVLQQYGGFSQYGGRITSLKWQILTFWVGKIKSILKDKNSKYSK